MRRTRVHLAVGLVVGACAAPARALRPAVPAPSPATRVDPPEGGVARRVRLPPLPASVVEHRGGVARVVWGAWRAEVRGRDVTFAEASGEEPITDVARSGERWVFALDDGALMVSDTFLGAWRRVAHAPNPPRGWPPRVRVHDGPFAWVDGERRAWRLDGEAPVATGPAWPARAFRIDFVGARDGVMAVDGPRWLFTRDAGATWTLARAPSRCANPQASEHPAPPPPGDDLLSCAPQAPPVPAGVRDGHQTIARRMAFALVAREPAYLPALGPFALDAETLVAFDGEDLVHFDAETWRERRRVPTTWPRSLTLEGRHGDDLWGSTGEPAAEFRLGADGSSRRTSRRGRRSVVYPGTRFVRELHRVGRPRGAGDEVDGFDCYQRCPDPDHCGDVWCAHDASRWPVAPACEPPSFLFGDRVVGTCGALQGEASVRSWAAAGGDRGEGDVLHEGDVASPLRVTPDERWIYALSRDPPQRELRVAWGDAEGRWRTAPVLTRCFQITMLTPDRMLAECRDGRVVRTEDGGATWETVVGVAPRVRGQGERPHDPHTLCNAHYCAVTPDTVIASPWGAPGVAAEPAPAHVAADTDGALVRRFECASLRRLAITDAFDGDIDVGERGFAARRWLSEGERGVRQRLAWVGVDAGGVFAASREVELPAAFDSLGRAPVRISRSGLKITFDLSSGPAAARVAAAGPVRYELSGPPDAAVDWLAEAGCPVRRRPAFDGGLWRGPPEPRWEGRLDHADNPADWLFARADRCGAAVVRDGAAALHAWWPSPEAEPVRAPRPDFERASPCRAPSPPDTTRWSGPMRGSFEPNVAVSLYADYESSRAGVCLRAVGPQSIDGGAALVARGDGSLHGVREVDGEFREVRCVLR